MNVHLLNLIKPSLAYFLSSSFQQPTTSKHGLGQQIWHKTDKTNTKRLDSTRTSAACGPRTKDTQSLKAELRIRLRGKACLTIAQKHSLRPLKFYTVPTSSHDNNSNNTHTGIHMHTAQKNSSQNGHQITCHQWFLKCLSYSYLTLLQLLIHLNPFQNIFQTLGNVPCLLIF